MDLNVLLHYNNLVSQSKPNILLSYALCNATYPDFLKDQRNKIGMFLLDSGTWTLNMSKGPVSHITSEGYKRYLKTHGHLFNHYFNFDSDFSTDSFGTNLEHQLDLEKAGLTPLPVIHNVLEGPEFNYYLKNRTKYPYVAVGSNQKGTGKALRHLVQTYYDHGIKVHILGTTQYKLIANMPVYSCDASNWAQIGAFGNVKFWNPNVTTEDKTVRIYLDEYIQRKSRQDSYSISPYKKQFDAYLKNTLKMTYADLLKDNMNKQIANLHYCMELEREVNLVHAANKWI